MIRITTGTYNTSDYSVIKTFKYKKSALKFLKSIGYVYDELIKTSWTCSGLKYSLTFSF